MFIDGSYLKTEAGSYQTAHTITNLKSFLEYNPWPESAQMAEPIAFIRARQLAKN